MGLKTFTEGDIELTLPESTIKLDETPKCTPEGMKLVDFCFCADGKIYLIELKDPSHPKAARNRDDEIKRLIGNDLINSELAPKARGSYTWLHLMKKDNAPIVYIVLLGTSVLPIEDKALLTGFMDKLRTQIIHESGEPWLRDYIDNVIVVTDSDWDKVFDDFGWRLRRLSADVADESSGHAEV
ncbi:MAG TPA: hypothetical protein ENL03_03900 [Phycisphaerae bacterium]|nr:hypothetical protein [Phycisphaerae bacterium]